MSLPLRKHLVEIHLPISLDQAEKLRQQKRFMRTVSARRTAQIKSQMLAWAQGLAAGVVMFGPMVAADLLWWHR